MNEKQMATRIGVMWAFQQRLVQALVASGKLPQEEVDSILSGLAEARGDEGWQTLVRHLEEDLCPEEPRKPTPIGHVAEKVARRAQELRDVFGED